MWRHKIINILAILKAKFNIYREHLRARSNNFSEANFDIILICIACLFLLYYPLGALLTHKIDRNTDIEIKSSTSNESQTVEMISYLINQEVNEKIWTPNLPFFFPAAILDNMPNYQLGLLNGLSKFTTAFEKRIDGNINNKENNSKLYRAATLLRYPGTIWMFDQNNKIKPMPSASNQYRKARRMLTKYNQSLISGQNIFYKRTEDLAYILKKINISLKQSSNQLTVAIRENSSSLFDFKADDVFYYNQGKLYAYSMLVKALSYDYKQIIINYNLYQNWISLSKTLEQACNIQPSIVRNAELSSSWAPNHLAYLNADTIKASNILIKIIDSLEKILPEKEK